ncbi:LysR family transcriptional regulator [Acidisoma silvae]|uniref:LysR family transcriptional regulator n=1 Tax=Acidisoma silvae TaxID=2802396 RepID=A0A963YW05_9PROT|nr:LysR family transcriptional regulator [Acidisoma silvae]MCB8877885.1 LysR family transcriptional regulator [Acidisoma silvae]
MSTPVSPATLLQLLCFVRVVEAGSFAEAARRLEMTTSGVSKTIARFEAANGIKLLHRSTHSQSLTPEGEALLAEARETLKSVERLEAALAMTAHGGFAGRVRISGPTAFIRSCLIPLVPEFLEAHPQIGIDLRASDAADDLASQGVDVAIRAGSLDGVPGQVAQALFDFPWVACAAPRYLARDGLPHTPAELAQKDLIGYRNGGTGRVQPWRFRAAHSGDEPIRVVPNGRVIADDGLSAWEMVRSGQGIAWAPYWLAAEDLRSGQAVEVLRDFRVETTAMSMLRRERQVPRRTGAAIAFLRKNAWRWTEPGA